MFSRINYTITIKGTKKMPKIHIMHNKSGIQLTISMIKNKKQAYFNFTLLKP